MAKNKTAFSKVKTSVASLGVSSSVRFSRIPSPTDHSLTAEHNGRLFTVCMIFFQMMNWSAGEHFSCI